MIIVSETLSSLSAWLFDREEDRKPLFSKAALKTVGFVSKCSSFTRSAVAGYDAIYGLKDPPGLSALGFTSGFNAISGMLSLRRGLQSYQKSTDSRGATQASLAAAGGGLQATGGALFVAIRTLNLASKITHVNRLKSFAEFFGRASSSISQIGSLLACIGLLMKIEDAFSVVEECIYDTSAENSLERLQARARKDPEALARVTSKECVQAILSAQPQDAPAIVDRVYREGQKAMVAPALSIAMMAIGIGTSILVTATSMPTLVMVATAVNGGLALYSFGSALIGFIEEMRKKEHKPGSYDELLLKVLATGCCLVLGTTLFYHNSRSSKCIIGSLGLAWLMIHLAAMSKMRSRREYLEL